MASRARSFASCLRDCRMAVSRRALSASMSEAGILWRVMAAGGSVVPCTGPTATPAETAMPAKRRSRMPAERGARGRSALFIEAGLDQRGQGVQRLLGIPAFGAQFDRAARAGAQHHQAHDRTGGDLLPVLHHIHRGAEALG